MHATAFVFLLAISLAAPPDSQESDPCDSIDRLVERGQHDGQGELGDAGTLESELAAETATHVEVEPLDIEFQSLTSLRLHPDGDLPACDGVGKQAAGSGNSCPSTGAISTCPRRLSSATSFW